MKLTLAVVPSEIHWTPMCPPAVTICSIMSPAPDFRHQCYGCVLVAKGFYGGPNPSLMGSKVYFTDMNCKVGDSLLDKLGRVVRAAGICDIDMERKFVAIKMHFGEYGNLSFLRPNYAKVVADIVRENGGMPFLTDCNTLYVGRRKHALEHMDTANLNGFGPMTTGCQIIIADGLKGTDDVEIPIDGEYVRSAKIGRAIADSDVIITLSHFKCHEQAGFGGALKNLAMGCGSRRGKLEMHAAGKPSVDPDQCRSCGRCLGFCAESAISIDGKASIDQDRCVGCGRCIAVCPFDAIEPVYDEAPGILNCKIVEYAMAAVKDKPSFHISIICDVSPFCDCHGENDMPVVPNVGILASFDPVALDRACIDLVQKQPMIPGSLLYANCNGRKPADIFSCVQPSTRWQSTFEHAERMGFGSSDYEIVEVR